MPNPQGFATGHIRRPDKDHLIELSARKHGKRLQAQAATLSTVGLPTSWDSRTMGWIGPIKDQGQCGSCWDFSGTFVVEVAHYKAGTLPPDGSMALSEQYTLNCGRNGGCNGDDNVTVLEWAKQTGLPLSKDYGPYNASARGSCKFKPSMTLYKIDDWGFADGSGGNGVTPTEEIKSAILTYGCVGCAVDAGFRDPGTGVISGGGRNIDHDVGLLGWNDTATKTVSSGLSMRSVSVVASAGWWWMRNSWSEQWGDKGYAKIEYGAWSIGTEAVWAIVKGSVNIDFYI